MAHLDDYSYVTALSNWILGYDKYSNEYSKRLISDSTFPNDFYLLKDDMSIGIQKADKLIKKLGIYDNKAIKITTQCSPELNTTTNIGYVLKNTSAIKVKSVAILNELSEWHDIKVEELTAMSYLTTNLMQYKDLVPRSLSYLPIANKCQARCWFCFSDSSISTVQSQGQVNFRILKNICEEAKARGAERFVITGGGEPTLLDFKSLLEVISTAKQYFNKVVLITNGIGINNNQKLKQLEDVGLTVLSISRHSSDDGFNKNIMGIDNKTTQLLGKLSSSKMTKRLICVLQQRGVHNDKTISSYLDYAVHNGVSQVCFKELYVASQLESAYANAPENTYSMQQQVSLSVITSFCLRQGFKLQGTLPWGSPIYRAKWKGNTVDIACYTEPSVGWERKNGVARSWNILSDNSVYATLEDLDSKIKMKGI